MTIKNMMKIYCFLALIIGSTLFASAQGVINPRVEYQVNPIGLDTMTPRFYWQISDFEIGAKQTAYRLLVASSEDLLAQEKGDLWDSGKVKSNQCTHIEYAGKPLTVGKTNYWSVQVWDKDGMEYGWSEPAWFEIAPLKPADWKARWMEAPDPDRPVQKPQERWIWASQTTNNQTVAFRQTLEIPAGDSIVKAKASGTADDSFKLFVNNQLIGEGTTWNKNFIFDIAPALISGRNIIGIQARNEGGPAGLRFGFNVTLASGKVISLATDDTWKLAPDNTPDWLLPSIDTSSWQTATLIPDSQTSEWASDSTLRRSMLVRKGFTLANPVVKARAYVSGLGSYNLYINNKLVSGDLMAPGWTLFEKRVQFQTYDVTKLLQKGPNAIGAIIGNGWWGSRIGGENKQPGRDNVRFIMQLEIQFADGTTRTLVTDPTWRCHPSPILASDIYDGEEYDARLAIPDWLKPAYNDRSWANVMPSAQPVDTLVPQAKEPIIEHAKFVGKKFTEPRPGVHIIDFGQNFTGWVRIYLKNQKPGTQVKLRFGEVLNPDGTLYTENLRTARATDIYTCRGGEETWAPRFTYHGFQYVEVTGMNVKPNENNVIGIFVSSGEDLNGAIDIDNELIMKFQDCIVMGTRSNFYDVPTDCPQRDERLGWTGDTQIFANTSLWYLDAVRFYSKWMRDIRDCQDEEGAVRDVNPIRWGGPASPAWGEACIVVPWQVYRHYGDTRIIEENWECMTGWMNYMTRHTNNYLYERGGYGDWIAVVDSYQEPISAAYYYYDATLMAQMANAIGKDKEAAYYTDLAVKVRESFNHKYFDYKTNQYPGGTQTANLLPLHFGLAPDGRAQAVADNVAKDVIDRGIHLSTGFLGTGSINPMLSKHGHHDLAWRLATQTTYPSWGYMVKKGANTVWELWNSDTEGPGMNSRNHFCLGSVGEWYFESLGGVNIVQPGKQKMLFRPQPMADFNSILTQYQSLYGPNSIIYMHGVNGINVSVAIAPNSNAQVILPTLGKPDVTVKNMSAFTTDYISETFIVDGKPVMDIPGVTYKEATDDGIILEVEAGTYAFQISNVGTLPTIRYPLPPAPEAITQLTDDFNTSDLNSATWEVLDWGIESQAGSDINVTQHDGKLEISGKTPVNYWTGKAVLSKGAFTLVKGQKLTVNATLESYTTKGSGARAGIGLWVDSGNKLLFAYDTEKMHWSYNLNGRQGSGEIVSPEAFKAPAKLALLHDGDSVQLLLNGKKLADVPVNWNEQMRVLISGQARAEGDELKAVFGDLQAQLQTQ